MLSLSVLRGHMRAPAVQAVRRCLSVTVAEEATSQSLRKLRNIGISAHIDSGKTTLTERILFYTGRIREMHEVRGKDDKGAKMDSMELEAEKGITIASAATYCSWGEHHINIIDTPGHVDFTIEVERALRVLDGAVLVLCSVGGVQSQSLTVDRQMRRYEVPRVCFINKLDRMGANPSRVLGQIREKLHLNAAFLQLPMGLEDQFEGLIDLVTMEAWKFGGDKGEKPIKLESIPEAYLSQAQTARHELIERVAEVDEQLEEVFLMEEDPTVDLLQAAIRRATIARSFAPVLLGSAFKNKGVQSLLDAVVAYLPNPMEVKNFAMDPEKKDERVQVLPKPDAALVGLAFKLQENKFGQLTYMRVYQGSLRKGDNIVNMRTRKKTKVPRLVRMHSDEMEDIDEIGPGEICAIFGMECSSGDTFTDGTCNLSMESIFVPEPVVALSVAPKEKSNKNFSKALQRFSREDPTFRVRVDSESGQTIISGMGELHLEIYVERMKREYGCEVVTGRPYVAYRETIRQRAEFDYTHKKQSGGSGQFGRVAGFIELLPEGSTETFEFENQIIGNVIPPQYIAACQKGFAEAVEKGSLIGHPVWNVRVALTDGGAHAVDSSELAFRIACQMAFKQAFMRANPAILEPTMTVDITAPVEFQGTIIGQINRRKGIILNTESGSGDVSIQAEVPLNNMFGYSMDLRSATEGKGEFTMEYRQHALVPSNVQQELMAEYEKKQKEGKSS